MVDQQVIDLLSREKVAVLAMQLKDKTPHGATMHFSHRDDPLQLFFITESTSRKAQGLGQGAVPATVVVGFSDEEFITLQMDGMIEVVTDEDKLKPFKLAYYHRHPKSIKYDAEPGNMYLVFTPSWWRYSNFKAEPEVIFENQ